MQGQGAVRAQAVDIGMRRQAWGRSKAAIARCDVPGGLCEVQAALCEVQSASCSCKSVLHAAGEPEGG